MTVFAPSTAVQSKTGDENRKETVNENVICDFRECFSSLRSAADTGGREFMALRWSLEDICEGGDAIDMARPNGAWGN
jgi:hypothetical protein